MEVWPHDVIGRALIHMGVYDLAVSEVVWRLTDPGESVIDIGANIGYFTRLFGSRVGAGGRVIAFEAHPVLFDELRSNIERHPGDLAHVFELHQEAVSSHCGSVLLAVPPDFSSNRGISHVIEEGDVSAHLKIMPVPGVRLDDVIDPTLRIGVVKMDVEGHEHAVLAGAERMLSSGQVRDWVFEELSGQSEVVHTFEGYGYEVFRIERQFRRAFLAPGSSVQPLGHWEPPSYLATNDSVRARRVCARPGWQILSNRLDRRPDQQTSGRRAGVSQ